MDAERLPKVLVVEDDRTVRSMLRQLLAAESMRGSEAHDARAMYNAIAQIRPDLVLLDLILPDEDGLSALRRISPSFDGGIIIHSSRDDVIDRVAGLEAGADDYVCKPAHPRELLARVRAVLRRRRSKLQPTGRESAALMFEGFELDLADRRLVSPAGNQVELISREFELLRLLAIHPGRVLSRDSLMQHMHERGWLTHGRSIDQHVSQVRRKMEAEGVKTDLIRSVRGIGYVFTAQTTSR
jgi:two-component system phosphate regulon response regulator OmpR